MTCYDNERRSDYSYNEGATQYFDPNIHESMTPVGSQYQPSIYDPMGSLSTTPKPHQSFSPAYNTTPIQSTPPQSVYQNLFGASHISNNEYSPLGYQTPNYAQSPTYQYGNTPDSR